MKKIVTLSLLGHHLITSETGKRYFVKAFASNQRHTLAGRRKMMLREQTALEVLKGLAVPQFMSVSPQDIPAPFQDHRSSCYVTQSQIKGQPIDKAGLDPVEYVGSWLFILEQLVAFKCHQILYTDIKCANILAQKKPLKITIIDFDWAMPFTHPKEHVKVGFTQGFEPPELRELSDHSRKKRSHTKGTEQGVVYQLGILLPHCLTGMKNDSRHDPKRGLNAVAKKLRKIGAGELIKIITACLASKPQDRPANFEQVLDSVYALSQDGLPKKAIEIWRNLRTSYVKQLEEVGLEFPWI